MTTAWSPSRLGNLTGKRIIVTGATNGVGLGTARLLARAGAHVILAVRNTELGAQPLRSAAPHRSPNSISPTCPPCAHSPTSSTATLTS